MRESWNLLLEKLGIAKSYTDAAQNRREYVADDETLLKMVNYLGYKLDKIEDSAKLLEKLEKERWLYVLEPIYVLRQNNIVFDAVLPAEEADNLQMIIRNQQTDKTVEVLYVSAVTEEKMLGRKKYAKVEIRIENLTEPAYYDVELFTDSCKAHTILALTPDKCYEPEYLKNHKVWGMAVQLYSLKSKRNWGVGDFTDLKNLAALCQRQGADVIGLNPLNVLFHDFPENASPYSSISRLFLNPIYIDVEKVSGFKKEYLEGRKEELQNLRAA
ncbi:MAG: 4-alpha-glucanotransferase, partial [Pseudomonadota bacterium]|nr:4-alpha-glucanotransferase [Pseudomonadota bacterium]